MNTDIESAIQNLLDDYERQGHLKTHQVKRLLSKKDFSAQESLEVYEGLRKQGIEFEDGDAVSEKKKDLPGKEAADGEDGEAPPKTDILKWIMRGASKNKLLDHKEEMRCGAAIALGQRMKKALDGGDVSSADIAHKVIQEGKTARSKLITSNMRLVVSVAKQYKEFSSLDFADLIQEGMIGLLKAADRYDHQKGFRFSTYATWWIRQKIHRAINDTGETIRLPVYIREKMLKYFRVKKALENTLVGEPVAIARIASELGWSLEEAHFIYQLTQMRTLSLDAPVKDDHDITMQDCLPSSLPSASDIVDDHNLTALIEDLFKGLSPQQADILRRRFGFYQNGQSETLEKISEDYGITRERVRQIESKALAKMTHPTRIKKLMSFLDGDKTV